MENASKALIIAGAVLISILLISVGVLIMNSVDPMTEATGQQSESMAIQTFNAQFTQYEGDDVPGSQVRTLISTVKAAQKSYNRTVTITNEASLIVKATSRYTVTIKSYDTNGYINEITITANP